MRRAVIALSLVVWLLGVACGGDGGDAGHAGSGDHRDGGLTADGGSVPGAAADPAAATRRVVVRASDDMRFAPASLEVDAGDVVTFVVRNVGKTDHEFVLGDEAYQEQHEADMRAGDEHMSGLENAVEVVPGETARLTWRFSGSGTVLYGCHEPGHYEGGMVGTIAIG